MAISRERLQELINKGATIYALRLHSVSSTNEINYKIREIKLEPTDEYFIENDILKEKVPNKPQFRPVIIGNINNFYEFEKDAKWKLKYQHKTRTEELNLPNWEEFKDYNENISVSFVGEDWRVYELSIENNKIVLYEDEDIWLEWDATEENYIKACDLCLKLFEGGKE